MLADTKAHGTGCAKTRLPSAERRAAIVSAAMRLFGKNGFKGTTTREIALAVGVSEPVLYQHFSTKRELYTAIVDQMVAEAGCEFEAAMSQIDDAAEPVKFFSTLADRILEWYVHRGDHVRLLFFSALERHELAEIWHEKATAPFLNAVERAISLRKEQGHFRDIDSVIAARAFIGMVAHYCLTTTLYQMHVPGLTDREVVHRFVEFYIQGLRPQLQEDTSE